MRYSGIKIWVPALDARSCRVAAATPGGTRNDIPAPQQLDAFAHHRLSSAAELIYGR
jgi:hypothetical protein